MNDIGFDTTRLPIRLGNILMVPGYSYPEWGICGNEEELRRLSDEVSRSEWEGGTEKQMEYISEASKIAGSWDYPQIIGEKNAEIVSKLAKRFRDRFTVLDIGAGLSTVVMFDRLGENDKGRVYFNLLELSEERAEDAAQQLSERGLVRDKDYRVIVDCDMNIPGYLEPGTQNIVTAVASLHHAFLDRIFRIVYDVTSPGGYFATADWHYSFFEHPAHLYNFLKKFE